jgi:MFS family permease
LRRETWFISYGLVGLTQNGLVPVLMPLAAQHGGAAGLTYAAFSLLGVVAPFMGSWADRNGRHRDLLIWGSISCGLLLVAFGFTSGPLRLLFAAGAGLGAMAATTAGNVLAIQGQPGSAWDARVALLQRYMSTGQVVGLGTAGLLAASHPKVGFAVAGFALLAAGALAFASAPPRTPRNPANKPAPRPMVGGDAGISGPYHRSHHLSWRELASFLRVINRPLVYFLIVWMVAYPAMNGFATLFPVAMTREFGLNPIWPSWAYAVGVAASLLLYHPLGAATHRLGGGKMLILGVGLRLLLLGALAGACLGRIGSIGWVALIGFALIQFVWPALAVGANSLSVRLAPMARGESVGLFNAATSLAAAVGSALAGVIFGDAGFFGLAAYAFIVVGIALALCVIWLREWERPAEGQTQPI